MSGLIFLTAIGTVVISSRTVKIITRGVVIISGNSDIITCTVLIIARVAVTIIGTVVAVIGTIIIHTGTGVYGIFITVEQFIIVVSPASTTATKQYNRAEQKDNQGHSGVGNVSHNESLRTHL